MSPWWWPLLGLGGLVALLFVVSLLATVCAVIGAVIEWRRREYGVRHRIPRSIREKGVV